MHISWHITLYGSGWNIFYISRIKNFTDLSLGRWIYHLLDSCLSYCIISIVFFMTLQQQGFWHLTIQAGNLSSSGSYNALWLHFIPKFHLFTSNSRIEYDSWGYYWLETGIAHSFPIFLLTCTFSLKKGCKLYFLWLQNFESWNKICNNLYFWNTRFQKG